MKIFDGKKYFVYGNGLSGRAARNTIRTNGGKAKLYSDADGRFTLPKRDKYDGAVISPGIKPSHPVYAYCKDNGIEVYGEADIGFAVAGGERIVGVTGTNGKTTVTELIAAMTGGTACGNIGYPLSAAACKHGGTLVCELSSFQLHNIHTSPRIAVITNLAPDHIDWHGSEENYYADKCRIAKFMTEADALVLGEDIPLRALDALDTKAKIYRCSASSVCDGAYIYNGYFFFMGMRVCSVGYLRLPGEHNLKNALCAVAASKLAGADGSDIISALGSARLDSHRVEDLGVYGGKRWINDSKGTNISACLAAVESTVGEVCLIVGGRNKNADFDRLFCKLPDRVTSVIAMGECAQELRDSAVKFVSAKISVVNGLTEAVKASAETSAQTVLLSPACASFDEFGNYEKRGEKFMSEVKALYRK